MANREQSPGESAVVTKQQSSLSWIQENGLLFNGLALDQILPRLGFRQSEGTTPSGTKVVSSYSGGLFVQHPNSKGVVYNISGSESQIDGFASKLEKLTELLTARIKWLNTESRLLFGAISYKRVCLVVDAAADDEDFNEFIEGLCSLIKEQVSNITAFNIIRHWYSSGVKKFSDNMVGVSKESISQALEWLKEEPEHSDSVHVKNTRSGMMEAIQCATAMDNMDAILVLTAGSCATHTFSQLQDLVPSLSIPVNISLYSVKDKQLIEDYQSLTQQSNGRLHLYNTFPGSPSLSSSRPSSAWSSSSSNTSSSKALPNVTNSDVLLVWQELEETRNTLADIQAIQLEKRASQSTPGYTPTCNHSNEYISSENWLLTNGVTGNKLLYSDLVGSLAFQHCEGSVKIAKNHTHFDSYQDESVEMISFDEKRIEALYCRGFVHMRWKDGRIIHTHLDERPYQIYKEKVEKVIQRCEKRVDWLKKGSRELFGTILEKNVVVAVDTSSSMSGHLSLVKKKLRQLIHEQMIHKAGFSVLHFGSEVVSWKDHLVPASPQSISSVVEWVWSLEAEGSTNTLEALKRAARMPEVEAVYLLTDGRPDQPPETIVQAVQQWRKIPLHTISFNCADTKANRFLSKLAAMTGGRYHYYSEDLSDPDGPVTHRSDDLQLIEDEISLAKEQLIKAEQLRLECSRLQQIGKGKGRSSSSSSSTPSKSKRKKVSSLVQWLSANSLLSRNLTLIDALGNGSVSHDPAHIDILDTDVKGKVYEEILSKAHISGCGRVKLINPRGVDLQGYQKKLGQYIKECGIVAMRYGFGKLPVEAKKSLRTELGIRDTESPSFKEHYSSLCVKLEESGCDGVVEEMRRIMEEIKEAEQYIEQAEALMEDIKREHNQSCLLDSTDGLRSPPYPSSCSSSATSVSGSWVGASNCINSRGDKKNKGKVSRTRGQTIRRGQRVAALNPEDGLYYPGVVASLPQNGFCDVNLSMQYNIKILTKHLVPYGGSTPCPTLQHGDCVLVRVRVGQGEERKDLFLPAMISTCPGNPRVSGARYSVTLYGGRVVTCSRNALIKIGPVRYRQSCDEMMSRGGGSTEGQPRGGRVSRILSSLNRLSRVETSTAAMRQSPDPNYGSGMRLLRTPSPNTLSVTTLDDEVGGAADNIMTSEGKPQDHSFDNGCIVKSSSTEGLVPVERGIEVTTGPIVSVSERGTSPLPSLQDTGTSTGPIMVDTGISTLPEMKEVATTTSETEFKQLEEPKPTITDDTMATEETTPRQLSEDQSSGELTVGMLTEPIYKSTPTGSVSGDDHTSIHHHDNNKLDDSSNENTDTHLPKVGEQVLARWSDDGWYYKGVVVGSNEGEDGLCWLVKDATDLVETFRREDILTDHDDAGQSIGVGDYIVGLHPNYFHSYSPGLVEGVMGDGFHLVVQLYDTTKATLPRHEVYPITKEWYRDSVQFIEEQEQAWVGKTVIARSNKTGLFHPGVVIQHLKNSQKYVIKRVDGSTETMNSLDMFGELTRRRPLYIDDCVLALPSNDSNKPKGICFPGKIAGVQNDQVVVQLYNNERFLASCEQCFWISQEYYTHIINSISISIN